MALNAAPYGTWESPITAQHIVQGSIMFKQLIADGNELYWVEGRPEEKGRCVIVKASDHTDMFKPPFNARSTLHEYGGDCCAIRNGVIYFTNFKDQYLYRTQNGSTPKAVIAIDGVRFADFVISKDGNWIFSVMEDHRDRKECENLIVKINTKTKEITPLAKGYDFYAFPRINAQETKLAYIAWNHPNMMWDQSELFVTDLETNETRLIAGGKNESVSEPCWSPCGTKLSYVSDKDGFWKVYENGKTPLIDENYDFTFPLWSLGISRRAYVDSGGKSFLLTVATDKGRDFILCYDRNLHETFTYDFHEFSFINDLQTIEDKVVFFASTPKSPSAIYMMNPASGETRLIKKSKDSLGFGEEYISIPEVIEFPTTGGVTSFGFYYPPKNHGYTTNDQSEKPPLIVIAHGGPTGHSPPILNAKVQFFTSRGFAVLDVNYGGSTGHGRKYRDRLKKNWGKVDVDDCCNGALYLAKLGKVDRQRMGIEGGSAGGFTTLASLTFNNVFKAGVSLFGVSDLALLLQDGHKYESRYLDSLVGKYPEEKEKYIQYSPLYNTEKLSSPVLLLQGAEDKVVPPNQSEVMYKVLLEKKIPTAYVLYEKEQHGFRIAENIIHSLESELYFFRRIFNIPTDTKNAPIVIENLD